MAGQKINYMDSLDRQNKKNMKYPETGKEQTNCILQSQDRVRLNTHGTQNVW